MKAKHLKVIDGTFSPCEPSLSTHIALGLHGPLPCRILPVMIDGSVESPTVKPSVLTCGGDVDGQHVCHSFINGNVLYLSDCSHELAGLTLPLNEVEE